MNKIDENNNNNKKIIKKINLNAFLFYLLLIKKWGERKKDENFLCLHCCKKKN